MAIKLNSTLGAGIKQVDATDKGGPKTHPSQSGTKKGPVHPVESLFLVQRENSKTGVSVRLWAALKEDCKYSYKKNHQAKNHA